MPDLPKLIDKVEKREDAQTPLFVKALKIATYPVAALAAYFVGRTEVRKGIYKNFVTSGAFKDLQTPHRQEIHDIMVHPALDPNGPALVEASNDAYRIAVKEKFEKAGFKSTRDFWRGLHPNQKANALMFAAGAAGIVITTSLAFVNNKALLEKLTNKEKEETGLGDSITGT